MADTETHRIPFQTPIHPRRKMFISPDIDVQAVGLITSTSFIGRHVRLAVILRISGRTRVYYLNDNASIDLVVGRRAVQANVIDAIAGAALNCRWRAGRRDVVGGWVLATVCCAERGFQSDEHRTRALCCGSKKG